ncbi:MAG: hypothetical protein ABII25_10085 [bacterium]
MKFLCLCLVIIVAGRSSLVASEEGKKEVESGEWRVESRGEGPSPKDESRNTNDERRNTSDEIGVVQEDYSLVPSIVSDSLQLYREQGAEAFIKSILKGSPLEGDESSTKELERMRVVERYYGRMLRHNFISVLKITSFYKKIYIILQFEKGPVFSGIDCYYTSKNTWIVSAFAFNTDISKVFPDIMLKQYLENNVTK